MRKTETQELTEAVQLYLDLMYDGDVKKFDRVFASTSQLHGFREGKINMLASGAVQGGAGWPQVAEGARLPA